MTDTVATAGDGAPNKQRAAHIWERSENDAYVEPGWCSARLFEAEDFVETVWDPACGLGTICGMADAAGLKCWGSDISPCGRNNPHGKSQDFFDFSDPVSNIVSNPPFGLFQRFAERALLLAHRKVALIWLARTLPAARWLRNTPLARVYFLTPRPSMPPASYLLAGKKASGGTLDFCWLVWDKRHVGRAEMLWLHRDHGVL